MDFHTDISVPLGHLSIPPQCVGHSLPINKQTTIKTSNEDKFSIFLLKDIFESDKNHSVTSLMLLKKFIFTVDCCVLHCVLLSLNNFNSIFSLNFFLFNSHI